MFRTSFPNFKQLDKMDCGPTCLKIISKHYGKEVSLEDLRKSSYIDREGVSLAGIKEAGERIGLETFSVLITWEDLLNKAPLPCIVHWEGNHFVVVYRVTKTKVYISDPAKGKYTLSAGEFKKGWLSEENQGVAMLLEPTDTFTKGKLHSRDDRNHLIKTLKYLFDYKKLLWQLSLGLLLSSIIQLALPFFTQSIVDYGIENQDLGFIQVILIGQVFFVLSKGAVEILRDWILLHISMRINIRMMNDYLTRLIQLPISFFTGRGIGDLVRRINDNERVEEFFTNGSLTFLFDIFNIVLFGFVLAYYNLKIFLVFLLGSGIYLIWSLAFMKKKALLDTTYFGTSAKSQSKILQIIYNIEDIKVNGSEDRRKKEWYETQLDLFNITSENLRVHQLQTNGGQIINELKNIAIIFLSAYAVVEGVFSLGVMLAIQFIIGQLNVPLSKMIDFLLDYQKAELAVKRLFEVWNEEPEGHNLEGIAKAPHRTITLRDVSFRYGPPGTKEALSNINMEIPRGKVTAIVGHSGSGKSTLLKLLLQFHSPTRGKVEVGKISLSTITPKDWREICGVVLQEGQLFDDTIERNITESRSKTPLNVERYQRAIDFAMLRGFVDDLPHGSKTKVGENGIKLSGGEKQRILMARAIYKDPKYFFLDEATSSLDSINEKGILKNLESFYKNRTVVIVAHRLSTIRNADNIIVLEHGNVVEQGTHKKLLKSKSVYWRLVMNQMDSIDDGR
ncbi:peptidase domain-containing ABC transporter [Flagellimonas sp. S3867]|uniref:peptidase domain-containing ABC transporter n=1 Tax=Flagellimonas sp. S3867 TaxID=2768063 RepID=UPI001686B97D|nr:peptidase domain-containing ABC transporter [Flagellimonas sp. S3867]